MPPKVKVFMTGITGYIGGAVLQRFFERPDADNFEFIGLVRSTEKAERFKSFGVEAVVGSLNDHELLEELVSEADVTIAMANADDLPGAQATLRGLKKRYEATGKQAIFINTSGAGIVADDAHGLKSTDVIYDDANPDQIETLPPTQPHRSVDLEIVQADKEGYAKTYIILPSKVYGIAKGKLFDSGLSNPHSINIPNLIRASLDRGQGGMIGQGQNIFANVEIHEVADLYSVLYDAIISNHPAATHGREGFYFGTNGEHKLYDLYKEIAKELYEAGRGKSPEPTPFTREEINKYLRGSEFLGTNTRCIATHSYSIGWKPVKTTADLLASIKPEVEVTIAKSK